MVYTNCCDIYNKLRYTYNTLNIIIKIYIKDSEYSDTSQAPNDFLPYNNNMSYSCIPPTEPRKKYHVVGTFRLVLIIYIR